MDIVTVEGEIHNVLHLLYRDKKLCLYHTINLVFLLISTNRHTVASDCTCLTIHIPQHDQVYVLRAQRWLTMCLRL